ncbi:hypothetical protein SNEBB_000012 [Seison nebaliae]|nr:hypothetical protein SNEBB_000012 [Seison nebaliae]
MFPITYEARHLATFQLDSTKGLLTPEDGVRKLKLLLKNQGIWPVLCDFTLTKSSIQIRSKEQTIVEQFPFSSISGLTCVKEVVENLEIFLFISAKKDVSEMNIFNPTNDDAIKIIRTLNNLIEGNFNDIHHPNISVDKGMHRISEYPSKMIPVRPIHVPPTIEMNELHSRNNNSKYFGLIPDIAHSANQNVAVADCANTVNIILSEIEIFFARLSENARHRNNGGENSEKPNGMDRLRRKLPSDEEFVNILQKIKYCFNVLSKINSHIDKPNGTEIIHFIFTPLSIIFSVTKREILRNVWTPMLSPEAKSFLYKYLLDNEIDLLETGGPAWSVHTQITKEMLTLVKPNYHPTNSVKLKSTVMTTSSDNSIYTPNESMAKELQMKQVMIDIDNLWNYYKFHNIKFTVNALDNRKADNERELSVKAGEYLKIVDFRPSKHWCCLKNIRGNIGYVPKTIIRFTEKRDYSSDEEDLESIIDFRKKGHKANGRSDAYNNDVSHFNQQLPSVVAQNIQESPDTCRNFDQETDQFSWGRCNLPSNVIQRNISLNENIVLHSSNKNALPKRSMSQNRMINVNSTCDEMRRWMIMKGFSQQFISLFGQLNGRKLFGMSQKQIAECGEGRSFYDETEMNRFQNCVRLQKNISGCHTNTIDSELNHILQQRKKQTEQLTEN